MSNTNETLKALTDLSRYIHEQARYFETVTGFSSLETEKSKAELLGEVAKKLDDIIVSQFTVTVPPTVYLRQAEARLKSHKQYYMLFV